MEKFKHIKHLKNLATKYQNELYSLVIYFTYFLLFLIYFGVSESAPKYLSVLDFWVKIYVCLFLIIRFNPFMKIHVFTELDRKIAFSAGLIVLTTSALSSYLKNFKNFIKNKFEEKTNQNNLDSYKDNLNLYPDNLYPN